ncbi:MAG: TonB-dependent receptor [Opitutales bacterium]
MNQTVVRSLLRRISAPLLTGLIVSLLPLAAHAQGVVTGKVVDADTGNALPGVRVSSPAGIIYTDRYGEFRIADLSGSTDIRVSSIGYDAKTLSVSPGETDIQVELGGSIQELEAFTLTARNSAEARALNQQRSSENLTNVVSADVLGRFPDQNVAESINRLPGISVERDQGEGRFVVIRGINPDLNSVAIDGVQLASPDAGQRATLLDTIPSDALQQVEVNKAVLPSQPHDAIGGYINITTPSAYDYDNMVLRFTAQANYSELVDATQPKFNATWGDTFGEDRQYGLIVSASFGETEFGSDNQESEAWTLEENAAGEEHYIQDDAFEFREYDLVRERTGVSANFEYRPDPETLVYVRGNYNNYKDVETRNAGIIDFGAEAENAATEEDEDIVRFIDIREDRFRALDAPIEREFKDREENLGVSAISVGFEKTVGDWSFDGRLGYSFAEEDTPYDFETVYFLGVDEFDNEATKAAQIGENPNWRITRSDTNNPVLRYVPGTGIDPRVSGNYEFDEVENAFQLVEEDHLEVAFNAQYETDHAVLRYVKAGFLGRFKEKTSDAEVFVSDDNPAIVDTLDGLTLENPRDPFGTRLPHVALDYRQTFLANEDAFAMEREDGDSVFEDFTSNEDVYAGYAMAAFGRDAQELIVGLRVEHTEFETEGFDNDANPQSGSNSYTNWMPGVHYRYNFTENLVFRASWTNPIARPSFEQSAPITEIDDSDVFRGNPELEPFESMNLDASIEYYLPSLGVVSAAVFYKDVENFIFEQEISDAEISLNGTPTTVDLTTFNNGDDGDILGLELAYQQQFTNLPAPFDGLGIWANVTFSDSEATVQVGDVEEAPRTTPFIKQSDAVGTFAVSYEKYGFFARLSASYRSSYLDELGEEQVEDRYIDDFLQWDLSTSYQFNRQWTVFANLKNLSNEPFVAIWDVNDRLSQFEEYSWSGEVGVKWTY